MNNYHQIALQIIRIFFPEQRKWVARILIASAIPMLTGPVWEPYLNAVLRRYGDFVVPNPNVTAGWVLLVCGLVVFAANEVLDRRPKQVRVPVEDVADRKTLLTLFSELHLPTLDQFIHYGKLSITYVPVLHHFHGSEGVVQASNFHLHDRVIKSEVGGLHAALSRALSFGEYFVEMPNEKLQKFDSRRDIHADPRAREAHNDFIQAVYDVETHLRALCAAVRSKYPDFDFEATNRRALDDYKSYYQEPSPELSEHEFAVLAEIVRLEEVREAPTLQNLATAMGVPKVDVQVGLDNLTKLGHVKHLYPGGLHQKFTVLPSGRALYIRLRDSFAAAAASPR